MNRFRILPGLPAEGPPPVGFPANWGHDAREGFVVEFEPPSGETWVGNFGTGLGGLLDVQRHPNGRDVLVIASGPVWHVRPETREAVEIHTAAVQIWRLPDSDDLIFDCEGLAFFRVGAGGVVWHTRQISHDGFRHVSVDSRRITGEAWSYAGEEWRPFTVDTQTGATEGGNYAGPDTGLERLADR